MSSRRASHVGGTICCGCCPLAEVVHDALLLARDTAFVVIRHLFVYGTLQPGESRWHELASFVEGEGVRTTVPGRVYDTGLEYPAAKFSQTAPTDVIHGRVYEFADDRVDDALARLDVVEGAERGMYQRVVVETAAGSSAWAYECGDDELLVRRLPDGDWLLR